MISRPDTVTNPYLIYHTNKTKEFNEGVDNNRPVNHKSYQPFFGHTQTQYFYPIQEQAAVDILTLRRLLVRNYSPLLNQTQINCISLDYAPNQH